jgi:hypothetical protein
MWVFVYSVAACHNKVSKNFDSDHQPNKKWGGDLLELEKEYSYQMIYEYPNHVCVSLFLFLSQKLVLERSKLI